VAAGPRQEGADAAAEVLVAKEDEGDEEQDDAEEDPEQPVREAFGAPAGAWAWRITSTPPILIFSYFRNRRTSDSLSMRLDWRKRMRPSRSTMIVPGCNRPARSPGRSPASPGRSDS